MLFRAAIAVLTVAAIALVGWRLLEPSAAPVRNSEAASAPTGSDYYMLDATIYQMNKQGELAYRVKLDKTLHYPNGSARLRNIHVHYEAGTPTYWTLDAARGRVPAGSRDLHLTGGVTLRHPKPEGPTVVIQTDNAWVRTRKDIIETQAHVTAQAPGRIIEADGLRIYLNTHTMKLLDNVKVRYTP